MTTPRRLRKSFGEGQRPYRGARFATRLQRSAVKVSYAKNQPSKNWAAHGHYLAREGAAEIGERGLGFDAKREDLELPTTLRGWQAAGDAHVFHVIVSPERGAEIDVREHARKLVAQMERDLGTELEWAGVVHTNTAHPHAHLAVRGIDERGKTLTLARVYISRGLREVSRELVTRELGYRTREEIDLGREASIDRERSAGLGRVTPSATRAKSPGLSRGLLQMMRGLGHLERRAFGGGLDVSGRERPKSRGRGVEWLRAREFEREGERRSHVRVEGRERDR